MKTQTKRGFLAKAGALLAIAALAISASPVQAQDAVTDMPASSGVVITKLKQPAEAGTAANGEVQEDITGIAIPDVTFKAYAVPVKDGEKDLTPGTNAWQEKIATTTLDDSQVVSAGYGTAVREGVTGTDGKIIWDTDAEGKQGDDLDRGLYLIRETATPAGVVPAADFLLAVPLTNPGERDSWLKTIYIYPKSSVVTGSMSVDNATDYSVGDTVTWTINADIPQIRDNADGDVFLPTDFFAITDTFTNAELAPGAVAVMLGETPLELSVVEGDAGHYTLDTVSNEEDGTTTVTINFTTAGRDKMAQALRDSTATEVTATIDTEVKSIGTFTNKATIHPSGALDGETSFYTLPATVKYGNTTLVKKDTNGKPAKGAVFRVYSDKDSALAKNGSFLKTSEESEGEWVTNSEGKVVLGGFRYSGFADGKETTESHEYWLVETKAPEDQQLLAEPISFTITNFNGEDTVEVTNTANTNAFVLPLTGGTGTALLTILGLGILAIVLFVARSRRNAEA